VLIRREAMRSSATLASCVLLAATVPAQLLKNINTVPQVGASIPVHSNPGPFVQAGGRLYFAATSGATGRELFWIDTSGAPAHLLADVEPGPGGSSPADLVQLANGLLLFTASTTAHGREVWISDGTTAGTQLLLDISGPGEFTVPASLIAHQGHGYFLARPSGQFSPWLWRTDGTSAGTVPIESLGLTGSYAQVAQQLVSTGAALFYTASHSIFVGSSPVGIWRLHRSNGAPGGSQLVLQQVESDPPFGPRDLTAIGSRVIWTAQGIDTGLEPWVSDGTITGTSIVDLIPGVEGSNPAEFTVVGNRVFFSAYEAFVSGEVFASDGTAFGTVRVTSSTRQFWRPLYLFAAGNRCAYLTDDGVHGNELWTTGPTPNSDQMIADLQPGPLGSDPSGGIPFGGGHVFQASLPATGAELYVTDGTSAGTVLLADIAPGPASSSPGGFVAFGGRVYFAATTAQHGTELWVTDGTTAGTHLHTDIAAPLSDHSSFPEGFVALGDRVVFTANDGVTGTELWVTDGTTAGTQRLTDFQGAAGSITAGATPLTAFDGRAFVALDDGVHGSEPWISDGTVTGTYLLADLRVGSSSPVALTVWRGELYFAAGDGFNLALYATDGTPAGTRLVSAAMRVTPSAPVAFGDRLYFAATTLTDGTELWRTDGTTAGTQQVLDLRPGVQSSLAQLEAVSFGAHLYFAASGNGDTEVWRTDGTAAGTALFANVDPNGSSRPYDFRVQGNRFVFAARIAGSYQYFSSDGIVVQQLSFPPLSIDTNWRLGSNGVQQIAMLRGSNQSFELWGTDGTVAGSGVITQIHPNGNEFVNMRSWRVSSGRKLLFAAGNAVVGSEIFVTDGTAAGTGVLFDLAPGAADSHPGQVVRLGDRLVFGASAPATGFELYSLPFALVDDWVGEPFGIGCPGSSGVAPQLGTSGSATLGATLTVELAHAAALAPVLHFHAPDCARLDVGGCTVQLATPLFGVAGVTTATGTASLPLAVPATPSLVGVSLWQQSLVLDAGGALLGFAAVAPALEIVVGA
jgi:ELWxxDGT repeat protein